uniref:Uncharacterized protein n=1 Tax=Knipowitschia caucasica TaxID=637954 RepID=A0AAV2JA22_KNICA
MNFVLVQSALQTHRARVNTVIQKPPRTPADSSSHVPTSSASSCVKIHNFCARFSTNSGRVTERYTQTGLPSALPQPHSGAASGERRRDQCDSSGCRSSSEREPPTRLRSQAPVSGSGLRLRSQAPVWAPSVLRLRPHVPRGGSLTAQLQLRRYLSLLWQTQALVPQGAARTAQGPGEAEEERKRSRRGAGEEQERSRRGAGEENERSRRGAGERRTSPPLPPHSHRVG